MKINNLILTALTALALSALVGCSSETEFQQETSDIFIPEGMARVEFAIKGVKTGTSYAASPTVGLDPAERQIDDVTAYLFKMAAGQSVIADADQVGEVVTTTVADGKASFLMPADATENDRYTVVLVGNKACFDAAALAAVVKGSAYAALNAVETRENTAIMGDLLNGGLPMRALTSITIPAGGGKVTVDAKFSRPLSRFDIDNRALHSFKITSVVLENGRKKAQLNMAGTVGVVVGTPADVEYSTFISDVNERLTPPDLNPDGSNSKLRPAFYASPALDADNASLLVKGMLRSGLSEFPAEYAVPLVNKTTAAQIVIGTNKRYRITLTMDKDENIVGEVALDLGEWEDNDPVNPDVQPDLSYQVGSINPATVTYKVETRTFTVPGDVSSFRFEVINDMGVAPVIAGNDIVTGVKKVSSINTRVVKLTSYQVTLKGEEGKGSFSFTTKDAKEYAFNVSAGDPTIPYPGYTERAILVGDLYWAPVNIGAATVNDPGKLYQYGLMKAWDSAQEMVDNAGPDLGQARVGSSWLRNIASDEEQKLLVEKWTAVSNGGSDVPCPSGWRIPRNGELETLLAVTDVSFEVLSADVSKVTVKGIPFISKEYMHMSDASGTITTDEGGYMVSPNEHYIFDGLLCTKTALNYYSYDFSTLGGNDGLYIRCVKEKPVTP